MAYMFFEHEESYKIAINEMLNKCNICELNRFYTILLKHFYPGCV